MAFKSNLTKLFDAYHFETVSDEIRRDFIEVAGAAGLASAQAGAPLGDPLEDRFSGQLRDSLYRETKEETNRTFVKIAIPTRIKYAFVVVFGNKHRIANGFMLKAREDAYKAARGLFKKISKDALLKMNDQARGKL